MQLTTYGPGDPETWGPYLGHPLDPRTDDSADDDTLTAEEAREMAADELDRCSYSLSWFLNDVCPAEPRFEDVAAAAETLDAGDEHKLTSGALLALAFNDAARAVRALAVLRDRYRQHPMTEACVSDRASELQAEHAQAPAVPARQVRATSAQPWNFDVIQQRNHDLCHAAAVRLAQQQAQARLHACFEAIHGQRA
jgi:hypothetical protein